MIVEISEWIVGAWYISAPIVVLTVLFAIIMWGVFYQSYKSKSTLEEYKHPGTLIEVNGRKMHLYFSGQGSQTVVMDSALGSSCLDWSWIQPKIASAAKVVTYDRAGYGWSEPSENPRTSEEIVEELRELLVIARIPPPYILVGHSFGGLSMRLFQQKYPDEVSGLVLVDSTPENLFGTLPPDYIKKLSMERRMIKAAKLLAPFGLLRLFNMPMGNLILPEEQKEAARQLGYQTCAYTTAYRELLSMDKSMQQLSLLKGKQPLTIPVYVISRGEFQQGSLTEETILSVNQNWNKLQSEIAHTSSKHKHLIANESGHFIHCEKPEMVAELILTMIKEIEKDLLREDAK